MLEGMEPLPAVKSRHKAGGDGADGKRVWAVTERMTPAELDAAEARMEPVYKWPFKLDDFQVGHSRLVGADVTRLLLPAHWQRAVFPVVWGGLFVSHTRLLNAVVVECMAVVVYMAVVVSCVASERPLCTWTMGIVCSSPPTRPRARLWWRSMRSH